MIHILLVGVALMLAAVSLAGLIVYTLLVLYGEVHSDPVTKVLAYIVLVIFVLGASYLIGTDLTGTP
jgi:hypothetical protein